MSQLIAPQIDGLHSPHHGTGLVTDPCEELDISIVIQQVIGYLSSEFVDYLSSDSGIDVMGRGKILIFRIYLYPPNSEKVTMFQTTREYPD